MKYLSLLFFVLLLSGCDVLVLSEPPVKPVTDQQSAWQAHNKRLSQLDTWNIDGRISVRLDEEAWHANILWRQIDKAYHIQIFGPFGAGAIQLDGSPQAVVLTHDGRQTHSNDPEQLLAQQIGWRVPVKGLRFWTVGQAIPGEPAQIELDPAGRLAILRQNGWKIRYRRYVDTAGFTLPGKIFMDNEGLDVRLVIDNWQITRQPG